MKNKQTKAQIIADLKRREMEAVAAQAHTYYFADKAIRKVGTSDCMGSGVILSIAFVGGEEACPPVMILDGLSAATIEAIRADLKRSYELATLFKPGV